ncbi:MAG: hypothetical protein JXR84_10035 [Anaerolineae bacterium]|nr:hypothetical protein [Anaerolineae bacterium]
MMKWHLVLIFLVILMGCVFPVAVSASSLQTDGPGGVGDADGTSNLELWLKAGAGVYSNDTCTTAAANNDPVACWADQSGNDYNVTQSTTANQPSLQTGVVNNQPVTRYDGSADYLERSYESALNPTAFTIFGVWKTTGGPGDYRSPLTSRKDFQGYAFYAQSTWQFWVSNGMSYTSVGNTTVTADQWELITGDCISSSLSTLQRIYVNGAFNQQNASPTYLPNQEEGPLRVGTGDYSTGIPNYYFPGDIGEIIIFSTVLNDVERTLVHNYLSAKYDITLGAGDHYDGDTSGNGDFDLGVAGIGTDGTDSHTESHSEGMIVQNGTFLQDNGDWLLFGFKGGNNQTTAADLPSGWDTEYVPARWSRHWYIDVTDASGTSGGTVTIIFDMSDSGITGYSAGDASYYHLLGRSGTTGDFSDYTSTCGATVTTAGDRITFSGISVSCLGSNFTVGTTDSTNGPLGPAPTAVTLARFEAVPQADAILVTWETAMELDNVGFNLYRSTAVDGEYIQLNDTLIPSQSPGSIFGAVYTWFDTSVSRDQTYYYKLEDEDISGARTLTGPVSATFAAAPNVVGVQSIVAQNATWLSVLGVFAAFGGLAFLRRRRHTA